MKFKTIALLALTALMTACSANYEKEATDAIKETIAYPNTLEVVGSHIVQDKEYKNGIMVCLVIKYQNGAGGRSSGSVPTAIAIDTTKLNGDYVIRDLSMYASVAEMGNDELMHKCFIELQKELPRVDSFLKNNLHPMLKDMQYREYEAK